MGSKTNGDDNGGGDGGASLAELYAPRTLDDLPWSDEDKCALRDVLLAICTAPTQDTVLFCGDPGSGRSTLLQEVLVSAYIDAMFASVPAARATGVPRQFRERCVLSLYTQKLDGARFRQQLASFPYFQVGRPWHRLVLCDDADLMLDGERAALVETVRGLSRSSVAASRVRLFLTCASPERVPAALVRRAMVFRLPGLRGRCAENANNRARVAAYVVANTNTRCRTSDSVLRLWAESGGSETFHLADLWSALDALALGGGDGDGDGEEGVHSLVDSWLFGGGDDTDIDAIAGDLAASGVGTNDFLVLCWRRLCQRYPGRLPPAVTRVGLAIAEHLAFVPESRPSAVVLASTLRKLERDLR